MPGRCRRAQQQRCPTFIYLQFIRAAVHIFPRRLAVTAARCAAAEVVGAGLGRPPSRQEYNNFFFSVANVLLICNDRDKEYSLVALMVTLKPEYTVCQDTVLRVSLPTTSPRRLKLYLKIQEDCLKIALKFEKND